jgi:hypothetical protein
MRNALLAASLMVVLGSVAEGQQGRPPPGEYINTGGRGLRYCTNFARANKCWPRWDARMTTRVCNRSGVMARPSVALRGSQVMPRYQRKQ